MCEPFWMHNGATDRCTVGHCIDRGEVNAMSMPSAFLMGEGSL